MCSENIILKGLPSHSIGSTALKVQLTGTAMALASCGPTIPGMVPIQLVIPMITPAYFGAMSRGLMTTPATLIPDDPTANVRKITAVAVVVPQ